jgi:tRNA pseudouridine55 synthase
VHAFERAVRSSICSNWGSIRSCASTIECGSGTYVRSIVRDLGEGAWAAARMSRNCGGSGSTPSAHRACISWTLESLQALAERDPHCLEACLLPIEVGLVGYRRIDLTDDGMRRFEQGQRLQLNHEASGEYAVFDPAGRARGLAKIDENGSLKPERVFQRQDIARP